MDFVDLAFTPALEQARLIRSKEISPLELVELYLDRIQRLNPQLGSYFTVVGDRALAEAKAQTEQLAQKNTELPPFFGVPIAIKDLHPVAGISCSYGCRALADQVAVYDNAVVTRIRQAGFIILGKTATSEVGSLPYTEPDGFLPARNPWHLDYTPGGSSGGSAAAVAAALTPIAHGSDGGGSVRGPATCCGVVGIKPSRGRISAAPVGDNLSGMATVGPLARTVADAAALLDVMSGHILGDPYWLPDPAPAFGEVAIAAAREGCRPLKIAFTTEFAPIGSADPVCRQAVLETVQLLENLGHHVEPGCPSWEGLVEPFILVWRAGVGASGLPPAALGKMNRWLLSHGDTSGDYVRSVWTIQTIARRIVAFFEDYDALVLPVYAHPTIRVGEWADLSPEETMERIVNWVAPCPPFNASGQPAIAIPTGFTSAGLPVGVQIVGRPTEEATIIALAAQIEAAKPWSQHRPGMAIA